MSGVIRRDGYDVVMDWGWGRGGRFKETERFHVHDKAEIDGQVRKFITRISRRYAFDCGHIEHPLNPWIYDLTVTPSVESERVPVDAYGPLMEQAVADTRALIERGELFVNGNYNYAKPTCDPAKRPR